jgi:flavodoxin
MLLFALLGPLTIWNRTRGMLRQIARLEWRKRDDKPGRPRVLVAYDSRTGNTQKVAGAIAESMWADLRRVDEVADLRPYDMVVIGSPVISSKPTAKVARFLRDHPELDRYAVFVTYGAPVIGPGKVRKALACFTDAVGKAPLAVFRCKGRHALVNTYRTHPDDADLLDAFLFGAKLAQASAGRA